VYPNSQWFNTRNKHIQPDIKLQSVNYHGFAQLLLAYPLVVFAEVDFGVVVDEADAFALALGLGFDDEPLAFVVLGELVNVVAERV
jgi:hypothetical protein